MLHDKRNLNDQTSPSFLLCVFFFFFFGPPGDPTTVWSESECRVPRRVSYRHLWRHGDQSVVQRVQDQREQQVQPRDNTIKQLLQIFYSCRQSGASAKLLHNVMCLVYRSQPQEQQWNYNYHWVCLWCAVGTVWCNTLAAGQRPL